MGQRSIRFKHSERLTASCLFYNGKNFCLRGGQEQRNLRLSQLKRDTSLIDGIEVSSYVYQEFGSKIGRVGLVP